MIAAGVGEVVYGTSDPDPKASGGALRLTEAGVTVRANIASELTDPLYRAFHHSIVRERPYVIAKFAASLDGRVATRTGDSQWITGPAARARGHDLRQFSDAVIVGAETVIADNPALTARPHGRDPSHPLRVVLDSAGRTPKDAKIFSADAPGASVLAATERMEERRRAEYAAAGVEPLIFDQDTDGRVDLNALLAALHAGGVRSVLVEGGGEVHGAFMEAGLVNEVWAFISPQFIGQDGLPLTAWRGPDALANALRLENIETEFLEPDILIRGTLARERAEESEA